MTYSSPELIVQTSVEMLVWELGVSKYSMVGQSNCLPDLSQCHSFFKQQVATLLQD